MSATEKPRLVLAPRVEETSTATNSTTSTTTKASIGTSSHANTRLTIMCLPRKSKHKKEQQARGSHEEEPASYNSDDSEEDNRPGAVSACCRCWHI
jgi:hypothetical protein